MKSVLIVEDSTTTRSMIRALVEEVFDDVEIIEAPTGFEALKQLPAHDFDVVVTDINMPDINGLELINFIRKNPRFGKMRVLIVSTEKSAEDRQRGMDLGADAYITKPFKAQEFQSVLKNLLEQ